MTTVQLLRSKSHYEGVGENETAARPEVLLRVANSRSARFIALRSVGQMRPDLKMDPIRVPVIPSETFSF